jgi:Tfp pilus assembly protein PilN
MKQFNFFRPYIEKKAGIKLKKPLLIVAAVLVAATGGYAVYTQTAKSAMMNDMSAMSAFMAQPENLAQVEKYDKAKRNLDALNEYKAIIQSVNGIIDDKMVVNSKLTSYLSSTIPHNVYIESTSIDSSRIAIEGEARNRVAIAEYENNLINTGAFESVFIPEISTDKTTGNNTFSIDCTLKGGGGQ